MTQETHVKPKTYLPYQGVLATFLVSLAAYGIHLLPFSPFTMIGMDGQVMHPVEPMVIAIILAILAILVANLLHPKESDNKITNLVGVMRSSHLKERLQPGVDFTVKKLLPVAIVLMAVKFDLHTLLKISGQALLLNLFCVWVGYYAVVSIANKLGLDKQLTALIAIGTAICGGSAIVALAPIIKAKQTDTSLAITIISLFGLIAIFLFPFIGHLLALPNLAFGIWAGTAIQAVPQVVAAGFSYSSAAGEVALVVKMVRILLLAPMILFIVYRLHDANQTSQTLSLKSSIPGFILVFFMMVVLNSLGLWRGLDSLLPGSLSSIQAFTISSQLLMTMAMAGVGLNTDLAIMLRTGAKPLLAGTIAASVMTSISLLCVLLLWGH